MKRVNIGSNELGRPAFFCLWSVSLFKRLEVDALVAQAATEIYRRGSSLKSDKYKDELK